VSSVKPFQLLSFPSQISAASGPMLGSQSLQSGPGGLLAGALQPDCILSDASEPSQSMSAWHLMSPEGSPLAEQSSSMLLPQVPAWHSGEPNTIEASAPDLPRLRPQQLGDSGYGSFMLGWCTLGSIGAQSVSSGS